MLYKERWPWGMGKNAKWPLTSLPVVCAMALASVPDNGLYNGASSVARTKSSIFPTVALPKTLGTETMNTNH